MYDILITGFSGGSCKNIPKSLCGYHHFIMVPVSVICIPYLIFNAWIIFLAIKARAEINSGQNQEQILPKINQDIQELDIVAEQSQSKSEDV